MLVAGELHPFRRPEVPPSSTKSECIRVCGVEGRKGNAPGAAIGTLYVCERTPEIAQDSKDVFHGTCKKNYTYKTEQGFGDTRMTTAVIVLIQKTTTTAQEIKQRILPNY